MIPRRSSQPAKGPRTLAGAVFREPVGARLRPQLTAPAILPAPSEYFRGLPTSSVRPRAGREYGAPGSSVARSPQPRGDAGWEGRHHHDGSQGAGRSGLDGGVPDVHRAARSCPRAGRPAPCPGPSRTRREVCCPARRSNLSAPRGAPDQRRSPPTPTATTCSPTWRPTPTPQKSRWTASRRSARWHRGEPWRPSRRPDARAGGRRPIGNGQRDGRGPADPGAERRAVVHDHDRARSRTCRSRNRSFTELGGAGARHAHRAPTTARSAAAAATTSRSTASASSTPAATRIQLQMNVEAIAEVKVLTVQLSGRVRPVERRADRRGHQERHERFRGSLYDVERDSDWNSNSWANISRTAIPKTGLEADATGATRIGGPVGKPGGATSCSSSSRRSCGPRDGRRRHRRGSACRPRAERQGDFSQSLDNNGNLFNLIRDPRAGLPCTAADTTRLLPGRRRARQDSRGSAVSDSG